DEGKSGWRDLAQRRLLGNLRQDDRPVRGAGGDTRARAVAQEQRQARHARGHQPWQERRQLLILVLDCDRKTLAGRREREHLLDVSPVDEMVEPSFEIFRPFVAVVDVIGVLPHVDAKDWPAALDKRVLTVWRLGHLELAILDGKPRPA